MDARRVLIVGRVVRLVLVEPAIGLLAQQVGLGEAAGRVADGDALVGQRLPHHVRDFGGHVQAHEVKQFEGTHRKSGVLHDLVDRLDVGAGLEQQQRLVHVEGQDAGRVKAGPVVHDDHGFVLRKARGVGRGERGVGRLLRDDDLQERDVGDGREVVHAEHAGGIVRPLGDARNGEGGGVGGEDRLLVYHRLHLRQHRVLDRQVLGHRLDHHVGRAERCILGGGGNPFCDLVAGKGIDDPLFLLLVHGGPDGPFALGRELQGLVLEHHGAPVLGRHLGDAAAHEARPEHSHRLDGPCLIGIGVRLRRALREKQRHEGLRLRGEHQLAKILPLGVEPHVQSLLHSGLHGVDDARRGRIVAASSGFGARAGLPVDDASADRIPFEQAVAQRLLVALHGEGSFGQLVGGPAGGTRKTGGMNEGVHEADALGFFRVRILAGQHEGEGLLHPHEAGQELGAAPTGQKAELNLRQRHLGRVGGGGDAVVAVQGHLQAAPHHRAVQRGYGRDREPPHPLTQRVGLSAQSACLRRNLEGLEHLQVGPDDE